MAFNFEFNGVPMSEGVKSFSLVLVKVLKIGGTISLVRQKRHLLIRQ